MNTIKHEFADFANRDNDTVGEPSEDRSASKQELLLPQILAVAKNADNDETLLDSIVALLSPVGLIELLIAKKIAVAVKRNKKAEALEVEIDKYRHMSFFDNRIDTAMAKEMKAANWQLYRAIKYFIKCKESRLRHGHSVDGWERHYKLSLNYD